MIQYGCDYYNRKTLYELEEMNYEKHCIRGGKVENEKECGFYDNYNNGCYYRRMDGEYWNCFGR